MLFFGGLYIIEKTATHRGQEESVMKMIFAMLHSEDVDETVEELNKEKYWVTKLSLPPVAF